MTTPYDRELIARMLEEYLRWSGSPHRDTSVERQIALLREAGVHTASSEQPTGVVSVRTTDIPPGYFLIAEYALRELIGDEEIAKLIGACSFPVDNNAAPGVVDDAFIKAVAGVRRYSFKLERDGKAWGYYFTPDENGEVCKFYELRQALFFAALAQPKPDGPSVTLNPGEQPGHYKWLASAPLYDMPYGRYVYEATPPSAKPDAGEERV